jgi:Lectin C-type domain
LLVFSEHDNKTKSFYVTQDHKASWADGLEFCRKYDMEYVTFQSKAEAEYFDKISTPNTWIGVTDQANEGKFVFINGRDAKYLPWSYGQPDNYKDNEDCVETREPFAYGYNDKECSSVFLLACQLVEDVESEVLPEQDIEAAFEKVGKWGEF